MARKKSVVYYAHSMRKYGTKAEEHELMLLQEQFDRVIDPSQLPPQSTGYEAMQACFRLIDTVATALAFSTYKGHIGRGVYEEIWRAIVYGLPIFEIRRGKMNLWNGYLEIVDEQDWSVKYAKARAA